MPISLRPFPTALLNPCADPTFKMIFTSATEESHKALSEFLSDVIGKKITDLVLQPNELSGESSDDKQPEFDISCKIDGQFANIEIQGQNNNFSFGRRAEFHAAHLLNHYTPKGTDWVDVPKVYQISVLNFIYDADEPNSVNHYYFQNCNHRKLDDRLNIIFIELPKIAKLPDDIKKLTKTEMWGKFFLYAPIGEKRNFINDLIKETEGIKMAVTVLSNISEDEENWIRETRYWDRVSNEKTRIHQATEMGIEQGIEQGIKQGIDQGIKQGIDQGIKQGIEQTVKKLLTIGNMSLDQIAAVSGLPIEKIENLKLTI